jgi:hypothetical protein
VGMEKELENRYPVYKGENIKKVHTIFSLLPHATEKYVVNPKINLLHLTTTYALLTSLFSPSIYSLIFGLGVCGLSMYGFYISKNSYEHELSHSYRLRYYNFMKDVKGMKEKPYFAFLDRLERTVLNSSNKIKSFFSRELALLFSIPIILSKSDWYWEEELARYEAEKLSGIKVNIVNKKKREFFQLLESLRTDTYIPLKNNGIEELDEKLKFYLEHPPAIIPKYKMISKLYKEFVKNNQKYD